MGVEVPVLDDRTYEELLEDARKRIPVYEEDWTDHNAHDPGITVLELLTWLSESYRYQIDQIEDRHRRKYAQLLDELRGPAAATATVRVEPSADVSGETVESGTRLVADDGDTDEQFETIQRLVDEHSPAQAVGRAVELESSIVFGGHSYLGVNSVLPDEDLVVGEAALGRDSVLDTREAAGQLAVRSRLGEDTELS